MVVRTLFLRRDKNGGGGGRRHCCRRKTKGFSSSTGEFCAMVGRPAAGGRPPKAELEREAGGGDATAGLRSAGSLPPSPCTSPLL
jgi:hypothetical protein